ncbi:MAG: DUF4411 family protein [Candidatus Poribacteria bacterium]|nr:DUF4411 family protein [Candidatus Poribacteria bacterium]
MYVFDNNSFRELGSYYPNQFPSFWIEFNRAVENTKIITSVREVYKELEFYTRPRHAHITNWVKEHRSIFREPSLDELNFVNQILSTKNFKDILRHEHLYEGKPCADPFIIAAAKVIDGCVVTEESKKPNSPNIPNVCEYFNIECTKLQGFMEREGWSF